MYTLRTISEIRAGGVLVLDNGAQRTLDEVQKTAPETNQVEPKEISSLQELLNASKNLEPTSPELIAALNESSVNRHKTVNATAVWHIRPCQRLGLKSTYVPI